MDLIILLLMLFLPALAQVLVTSNYSKYKNIENEKNLSGFEVARKILDEKGLKEIYIVETKGNLTDHYDPKRKVVRLSNSVYHGKTIASIAIAAHECGHAIQDNENYIYMRLRALIFPIVNIATSMSYFIIFLGLIFESLNLIWMGIFCVGTGLIFQLVTLPVEIDASKRAKIEIQKLELASETETLGVSKMLTAAASTYLAGVLTSALELVRLFLLFGNRDDN
ncbi:MAG: zinc metallopeptidase [Bacilli bacterium]|jgi:hypothetical protein|nr:zinc metallopeptidase [Bacilli bacterium]